jgi:GNAT superfamily N-acetyltransferase
VVEHAMSAHFELVRGAAVVTTDPSALDLDVVHGWLSERSYWQRGVSREAVERAARHSLPFHLLVAGAQVGYARVVTDRTRFAYIADVFVLEAHRSSGLGAFLMQGVLAHPDVAGCRQVTLATEDAHGFYARFGFAAPTRPDRWMELRRP